METILIVAVTSFLTAFFSNLLAPRLNAWYERRYQDRKILKKTLRTLLEIELYVQRRLKHPSIIHFQKIFTERVKGIKNMNEQQIASLNSRFLSEIQNMVTSAQKILPDNTESLDKEFTAILSELSTVDPLLAFHISERHIISPIQQLKTFAVDVVNSMDIKASEADFLTFDEIFQPFQADVIDKMLNDLRMDILTVSQKIGRIMSWKMMAYYSKSDIKEKQNVENLTEKLFDRFHAMSQNHKETAPQEVNAK
jgi:hypothetical protein